MKPIQRFFTNFIQILKRGGKHNIFLLSAGIAFNCLICVIPLMLVAFSIAGFLVNQQQVEQSIIDFSQDFFPNADFRDQASQFIINEVRNFYTYGSAAGGIGSIVLLWSASVLVGSLRASLNHIFDIVPKRFYLINKLRDMGLTLVFLVLLFAASLIPSAISLFSSFGANHISESVLSWLTGITAEIIGICSLFVFFLFIYRVLPNKRLPRIITLGGSGAAVCLWEFARFVFGWYIGVFSSFGKIYGTFAVIGTIALWIYYTGYVILLTAEIMSFVEEKKRMSVKTD